jgi:NADPH-dependent ferric siderophore reductase
MVLVIASLANHFFMHLYAIAAILESLSRQILADTELTVSSNQSRFQSCQEAGMPTTIQIKICMTCTMATVLLQVPDSLMIATLIHIQTQTGSQHQPSRDVLSVPYLSNMHGHDEGHKLLDARVDRTSLFHLGSAGAY